MKVLFVCVENAGRRSALGRVAARSRDPRGGRRGAGGGWDRRLARTPKALERADVEWADLVVTMGCGDACPVLAGKEYVDWNLPDPAGLCLEEVRELRDVIEKRVSSLPL